MGKLVLLGILVTAACGRYGFESDPTLPDAPVAPTLLACGVAPKFSVGPTVRELAVVASSNGFALFTADTAKELRGWSYEWSGETLWAGSPVTLDTDITGAFGAAADGDKLIVAAVHGAATTLGTTYHAIDAQLGTRAAPITTAARVIGVEPLAKCGRSNELASIRYEAGDVAVHGLDANGAELGTRVHGVAAEVPTELTIVSAGTGYAIAWVDAAASPNVTKLALLDEFFAIAKGPVTVANALGFDTIRPRIRWAATSNTYAVTWFEKTPTGSDDVYVQVFDAQLHPTFAPKLVQADAVRPKVATDGTAFYVAYVNVAPNPDRMDIARVTPEGGVAIRAAAGGGGAPLAFAMVERGGQAVLVSLEASGDLWFDPLCP